MKRSFVLALIIAAAIAVQIYPQGKYSIQVTGGLISPLNSSKGAMGNVQLNYYNSPDIIFYLNAGLSYWDKTYIHFNVDNYTPIESKSQDSHIMSSYYLGARFFVHRDKVLNLFLEGEVGTAFLSYKNYGNVLQYTSDGKPVYTPVFDSDVNKNLFGLGVGAGITHNLGSRAEMLLELKYNTMASSGYSKLFYIDGTSTMLAFGFNLSI